LAEAEEGKIAGGDETMNNFNLEAQLEDLMIYHVTPQINQQTPGRRD
jgi:hypothetical protein